MISRRALLVSPLISPLAALSPAFAAGRPPNLLIFTSHEWRGQATPWASDPDLIAPNLKRFGDESLVFTRAYCASPRSAPARSALLTGRFPHTTGVITENATLPAEVPTISSVLKDAGYRTDFSAPSEKRLAAAVQYLEQNRSNPIFLLFDSQPREGVGSFDSKALHVRQNVTSGDGPKVRAPLAAYYGACAAIDKEFGSLLEALERLNLAKDTVVVFTSDHGTQLGSQGLDGDDEPFEESVSIPLAIRWPGAIKPSATDMPVSQVDLMPTLLALLDQPIEEKPQGRDLSAALRGDEAHRPESIYAEGKIGAPDEWRIVVRGLDKIIVNPRGEILHLFNLADDPFEMADLAHEMSQQIKIASMLALVKLWMKQVNDGIDPSGLKKRS